MQFLIPAARAGSCACLGGHQRELTDSSNLSQSSVALFGAAKIPLPSLSLLLHAFMLSWTAP
jgi:hypothetical protein